MEYLSHISEEEYRSVYIRDFKPVKVLKDESDISTLIEVFDNAMLEISTDFISNVVENNSGMFLFVTSREESNFDLLDFINQKYKSEVKINCVNARYLFPKGKSRGIFNTDMLEEEDTEEIATGFMDEDELEGILGDMSILYQKTGENISISFSGLSIGRSSKKSDFIIKDNGNVSRLHCRLYREGTSLYIEDCGSANGTYVNGEKITDIVELHNNDIIVLAGEEFKVIE